MIETLSVKIIGSILILFAGYLGYNYRHTDFDQIRFDRWRLRHLKRFPDAELEEVEEYRKTQQGAPLGQWLQGKYMKELEHGKILALIFGGIGTVLTIFS